MAQLECNLVKDAKNKKSFYRFVCQKRKVKVSVAPEISKAGKLITIGKEKTVVINNIFPHSSHTF